MERVPPLPPAGRWEDGSLPDGEMGRLSDAIQKVKAIFVNGRYQVNLYGWPDGVTFQLSIKRRDKEPIFDWCELQGIKNHIAGPDMMAVEVYPAESRVIDMANQYHLWIRSPRKPFPRLNLAGDEFDRCSRVKPDPLVTEVPAIPWTPLNADGRGGIRRAENSIVAVKVKVIVIGGDLWKQVRVTRNDGLPIHDWRVLQKVKTEVLGPDAEAVEVYPTEADRVNVPFFCLWSPVGRKLDFGYDDGRVIGGTSSHGAKQRPFRPGEEPEGMTDVAALMDMLLERNRKEA